MGTANLDTLQRSTTVADASQTRAVARRRAGWRQIRIAQLRWRLALEVGGESLAEGARVNVCRDKAEDPTKSNQHWTIMRQSDGTYQLANTLSGLHLSAPAGGAVIQSATGAQTWRIAVVQ